MRSATHHPTGSTGGLIRRLIARAAERRSLAQLSRLDDRLLRDVGLTRADVQALIEHGRR